MFLALWSMIYSGELVPGVKNITDISNSNSNFSFFWFGYSDISRCPSISIPYSKIQFMTETVGIVVGGVSNNCGSATNSNRNYQETDQSEEFSHFNHSSSRQVYQHVVPQTKLMSPSSLRTSVLTNPC
jgi:hypothetical protein